MSQFIWYLVIYLLGGVTFIPLIIATIYYFSLWYLPDTKTSEEAEDGDLIKDLLDDRIPKSQNQPSLLEKELDTGTEAFISGWLTVSREYFYYPSGGPKNSMNPPGQSVNETSMQQNESAYSSLYRVMSNNVSGNGNGTAKSVMLNASSDKSDTSIGIMSSQAKQQTSKSRLTKYFGVLRHGNLFLYTDEEQTKVKQVIVIGNHVVTMWPRNVPDGELFLKRSAICLAKINSNLSESVSFSWNPDQPPQDAYFLYSDSCSEKEDFYFALIRASKNAARWDNKNDLEVLDHDPSIMALPLHYKTTEIMDLIQTLHSTDANLQTRWLNAIIGRLFLSIKDTENFEGFFRNKIIKKLSRMKRPMFLGDIELKTISCGSGIPYFTNPKLKELSPEGLLLVEANVSYSGNFAVEIATKAILSLGGRIKPREFSLVLSVVLKSLEGKLVLKIKPPPSDRLWYAFETMPKLQLHIEPVVSTKQITYSVVTNAIESRIREVFKETLVLPNMDDLSFFDTSYEFYRGGIWDPSVRPEKKPQPEEMADISEVRLDDSEAFSTAAEVEVERDSLRRRRSIGDKKKEPTQANTESDLDKNRAKTDLRGFGFSPESNSNPALIGQTSRSAALVGSVKKWGTWYFKEKILNRLDTDESKPSNNSLNGSEATIHEVSPRAAPLPHNFPPEIINQLNEERRFSPSSNPYTPTPEMHLPGLNATTVKTHQEKPNTINPSNGTTNLHEPPPTFAKRKPVASDQPDDDTKNEEQSRDIGGHDKVWTIPISEPSNGSNSGSGSASISSSFSGESGRSTRMSVVSIKSEEGSVNKEGIILYTEGPTAIVSTTSTDTFVEETSRSRTSSVPAESRYTVKRKVVGSGVHAVNRGSISPLFGPEQTVKSSASSVRSIASDDFSSHVKSVDEELPFTLEA